MATFRAGKSLPFNVYVVLDTYNPMMDGYLLQAWSKAAADELVEALNEHYAATDPEYFRSIVYVKHMTDTIMKRIPESDR